MGKRTSECVFFNLMYGFCGGKPHCVKECCAHSKKCLTVVLFICQLSLLNPEPTLQLRSTLIGTHLEPLYHLQDPAKFSTLGLCEPIGLVKLSLPRLMGSLPGIGIVSL